MGTLVLCGVPGRSCKGSKRKVSQGMGKFVMSHADSKEAFNCKVDFLLSQGYKRREGYIRDFIPPDGGHILMLTKQSKFGAFMRNGKESARSMPVGRRGGLVISS